MPESSDASPSPPPDDARQLANIAAALRSVEHPVRIGPYQVERILGEGGMGTVYLATQTQPIARTVAIKVIRVGLDTQEVITRFENERRTLEMMEHPNIARVLDAGVTETGKPYFVMEYVQGPSLTTYADTHQLTVRHRLELFLQACAAVQHAHQKAIIHRDLKPSNILVTERDARPTVRVIDFGVATAMRRETTARTTFVESGQLLGTPEYMAPEQAQTPVADVDTRTDVYSLGVVLYELLSGALPFDPQTLRSAGYAEIQRIIREVDPPRPSTRLSGLGEDAREIARRRQTPLGSLERELKSELEWIPLKAMHKDRDERYASATELAADIENYLASRPLRAGPLSRAYRVRKFVRRNRVGVGVASAMLVLLVAGVGATAWQSIRAARAESAARAEQAATSRVNDFLIDMFQSVDPRLARGKPVLVLDILDKAAEQVDAKLHDQPEVEAAVRAALGVGYHGIAQYDKAEPHVTRALDLYRSRYGEDHPKTLEVLDLLGVLRHRQGRFTEAISIAQDAYARHVCTQGAGSADALNSLNNLAVMQQLTGDYTSAEQGFRAVWQGYVTLFGADDRKTLDAERKVAQLQISLGRYDEAEQMLRDVDERLRRVNGMDDIATVNNITELARVMHYTGKFDEAARLAREGLDRSKIVYGEDHSHTVAAQYALAIALSDLRRDEAIDLYLDAIERSRRISGPTNPATLSIMNGTSIELARLGRHEEAIELNREALAGLTETVGPDNPQRLAALFNLCRKLHGLGRWEESLPYAIELDQRLGEGSKVQFDARRRARYRAMLGLTLSKLGRHREAEQALLESQQALSAAGENLDVQREVLDALIATSTALSKPADVARWSQLLAQMPPASGPTTRP